MSEYEDAKADFIKKYQTGKDDLPPAFYQVSGALIQSADKEIERAYFRGLRDAKVMVFRYGCEMGDSEEYIGAMIEAQNLIALLIDKETMDEARKLVRTWPGYNV